MATTKIFLIVAALLLMGAAATPKTEHDCILTVEIADRPKDAEYRYWCHGNGPTKRIKIPPGFSHGKFKTGDKVNIQGRDNIEQGQPVLEIDGNADISQAQMPADTQFTLIDNKVLVAIVSYSDQASPFTLQQVKDNFTQVVNPFFVAQSYGKIKLIGIKNPSEPADFFEAKIALASGGCDIFTVIQQAQQISHALGFANGSDIYHRFLYIIPNSPCGFAGIATVGSYGGYAVSNGDLSSNCRVICHELGHNLGLFHASCSAGEYCDYSDMMGNTSGVYGGPKRDQIGWVNTPGQPTLPLVTQAGDYTIRSLELGGTGQNGIKFLDPLKPNTNFYATYHAGDGWSTGKPVGVYIHEGPIDTLTNSIIRDKFQVGETFQADAYTQLYLSVKLMTPTQAVVSLSFTDPALSVPTAPTLTATLNAGPPPAGVPGAPTLSATLGAVGLPSAPNLTATLQ